MERSNCRGCENKNLIKFLELGEMPLAGGFLPDVESIQDEILYNLDIFVCADCGLLQILELVEPDILFQDYSFSSSTVDPLVTHFEEYAQWIKNKIQPQFVVEFGCNDGVLLKPLNKLGIKTFGIDVSENITNIAISAGLDVIAGFFDEEIARDIRKRFGRADVVTGSNCFAHNDNPQSILYAAKEILKPNGYLCLEVMYAGDMLEQLQWDVLYHEHLTFYCLETLSNLLRKHGFYIIDAKRLKMHGGSLRIMATQNKNEGIGSSVKEITAYEKKVSLFEPKTWVNFGKDIGRKINIVDQTLNNIKNNSRIWGYGAAGKATLWVNACNMDYLEAMVDASPLRAGKFMPGTHTPIVFPDKIKINPPDYIFVTAWNYAELIKSKEKWFNGTWITPLPDLKFF